MRDHLGLQLFVPARLRRLALQRIHLPPDLFQNVEHARQILFRAFQLGFRQPFLGFEFADPRGFFDDRAAVLRLVAEDLPDASLLDDGVAFRAQARADEEILDVAQTRGPAVDQVFAFARPEQPPRDGNFAWFVNRMTMAVRVTILFMPIVQVNNGMLRVGGRIHQRHRNRRQPKWLAVARSGEDHVFHPRPAQALGRLLAQHPADRVAEVGFSTAVGSNHRRDTRTGELHLGSVKEGLKALNFNPLELQQSTVPFLLSSRGMGLW